jgi:hypothetical protein
MNRKKLSRWDKADARTAMLLLKLFKEYKKQKPVARLNISDRSSKVLNLRSGV